MKKNDKIIKKVKGLLAIARDEKNDEESQSAFVLAQKLMIQYEINKNEVEAYGDVSELDELDNATVTVFKKLYWWERKLAVIIADNFRVKNYIKIKYIGRQYKKQIVFYGFGRDLELAKEMYILAYDAVLYYSKKYINRYYIENELLRTRYITESIKASYIDGFISGLSQRFDEQISKLRESYELLVLIPEEVEKTFNEMSAEWESANLNPPPVQIMEAHCQGMSDGKKIDFTGSELPDEEDFKERK